MSETLNGSDLLKALKSTLRRAGIDIEKNIQLLGQAAALERRLNGETFSLQEHVKGLIFAQLSNQRPWEPVSKKLPELKQVFFGYDPDALAKADPTELTSQVCDLSCGNRQVAAQMASLRDNIETLRRIDEKEESLDAFVCSDLPIVIAKKLASPGPYKLKQIGVTLAMEYLRNVGVDAAKPDVHLTRILSAERLGYCSSKPTEREVVECVARLASDAGTSATYMDNLLWLVCADGYGEVCQAQPRCSVCSMRTICNYPGP